MSKLKKGSGAIACRQKYSFMKWRKPSSHHKATKKTPFKQDAGKKIVLHFPRDVALSNSEEYVTKIIKDALKMSRTQSSKIHRVFNHCEDARREGKRYNGKQNAFVRLENKDPAMPPVPPGTKPDWVATYLHEEKIKRECLQDLIAEDKEKRSICPLYSVQPHLPILLPENDPKKFTKIKCKADWDEAHPKAKVGVVMKNNCQYEYAFARTVYGKFDKALGSYQKKAPTQTIRKYKSASHFLFGFVEVLLDDDTMVERHLKPFYYTNQMVFLQAGQEKHLKGEILHVRRRWSEKVWVEKADRGEGKFWRMMMCCK
eukprot:15364616-Ditylum_brightwellii.AAC.1